MGTKYYAKKRRAETGTSQSTEHQEREHTILFRRLQIKLCPNMKRLSRRLYRMFKEKKPNERIIASRENEGHIARRCEEAAKLRKEVRQEKILEDLIKRGKKKQLHK